MIVNIIHVPKSLCFTEKEEGVEAIRCQSYMEEMAMQGARYMVWDGIVDKPVFKGISQSHKAVVKYAKENKFESVCIMEDDCKFSHPDSLKYFKENMPKDFDLFFGLIYQGEIGEDNRVLNGFSGGLTCYVVKKSFYDTFLQVKSSWHLDNVLGEIAHKHKFYVCNPPICKQMNGYSLHHEKEMKYDQYLEGRELFSGL